MADDLYSVLTRFHREVFLPDFERILKHREPIDRLRDDMLAQFGRIARKMDQVIADAEAARKELEGRGLI